MLRRAKQIAAAAVLLAAGAVQAIQVCELNGESINPNNGATTAGKTGLMRCRDGEGGPVQREQELKDGKYLGIVRYFNKGVLQKEYSVNDRGNREGRSREWAGTAPDNPLLREETLRNSTTVGLSRQWHLNGQLRRATFYGDDGREQAVAEFTPEGKLYELRCGKEPQLAPAADDARWCGFKTSGIVVTELYGSKGLRGRVGYERGELRRRESLDEDGKPTEQVEIAADGGVERRFGPNGAKRRETRWVTKPAARDGDRPRRITVLEQEFHDSGSLVHERRWNAETPSADLVLEQHWYLNGQPRDKDEYATVEGQRQRRETRYHDNGRVAFEGAWLQAARYEGIATGTHKSFDEQGRLRGERVYDARGRVSRERELDENGRVVRDDEVFEDGSRKAYAR